jgi:hypothetical protein
METVNELWQVRPKRGKGKRFAAPEQLWEAACEYFEWSEANPMIEVKYIGIHRREKPKPRPFTRGALCLYLGLNPQYLKTFKAQLRPDDPQAEEWANVIERIEDVIYGQKFQGAAVGFFNIRIIARELDLARKAHTITISTSVNVRRDEENGGIVIEMG